MTRKRKLHTITIALSAYNEEKNIIPFLESLLLQKEKDFRIIKVLIISDGSTDDTVINAKRVLVPNLELRNYKKRTGKSTRLNEIYSGLTSDYLIQFDADVIFSDPLLISKMIEPMVKDKHIGMTGGNIMPCKPKTFTEKAVQCTADAYIPLRRYINVISVNGPVLAFRTKFISKIVVPKDMLSNDVFTYLCCITNGYKYKFVQSAMLNYKSPDTLSDQIKQNTRFSAARDRLKKYFPSTLVNREYHIPSWLLIQEQFKQFVRHPVLCLYIFGVNKYCQLKALKNGRKIGAKWDMAKSTKKIHSTQ